MDQEERELAFRRQLENNFTIIRIMGDGNCFYRCVARFRGDESQHEQVRRDAITHMSRNLRFYGGFFRNGEFNEQERDREFADEQVIHAISQAYQINIVVIQSPPTPQVIHPPTGEFNSTMFLYLHDEHFELLQPIIRPPPPNPSPPVKEQKSKESVSSGKGKEDDKPFKCSICGKSFKRKYDRNQHEKIHSNEKKYRCDQCSKSFSVKKYLQRHKKTHRDDKPYVCKICGHCSRTSSNLSEHLKTHSKEKSHQCTKCGKRFLRKGDLKVHLQTHDPQKKFMCDVCQKRFTFKRDLTIHQRIHTGDKPCVCKICGHRARSTSNLAIHIRTHKSDRPHQCTKCGKRFVSKRNLTIHLKTHDPDKKFMCDVCKKSFTFKSDLTVHQRIHTRDKPYLCKICGHRFLWRNSLVVHKYAHLSKTIKCPYCIQSFSSNSQLWRHIGIRHGSVSKISCEICNKILKNRNSYYEHRMTHRKRRFICPNCKEVFGTRQGRRLHRIKAHSVKSKPSTNKDTKCSCGATGLNAHSWHFHRICRHASDEANHILGPREDVDINNYNTNAMKLKSKEDVEFFKKNIKTAENGNITCCDYQFLSRKCFNAHLVYHRQQSETSLLAKQHDGIKKSYNSVEEAIFGVMNDVYYPSQQLFQTRDLFRKVYVLVFVPTSINNDQLVHYVSNNKNEYALYIGAKSGLDGKISPHHHSGESVVCTSIYSSLKQDMRCVHIMDIFIKEQSGIFGLDTLQRDEAFLILKLMLYCKRYHKNYMIQKLETAPLKTFLKKQDFDAITADINDCQGDFFKLETMSVQFIKDIKIKTSHVTEEMKKRLVCGICGEQASSNHQLNQHRFISHKDEKVPSWMKMPVKDLFDYSEFAKVLHQIGDEKNHFLYVAGGFKEPIQGSVMKHLENAEQVNVYVGKKTGLGDAPSSYHSAEGKPSTIKEMKNCHRFVYQICNFSFSNPRELEKAERTLIIIGILRKHMRNVAQSVIIANIHMVLWDISHLFTEAEMQNLIRYAYSDQSFFTSPPETFPSPNFFNNKKL